MRVSALAYAAVLGLGLVSPALAQGNRPTDTGNMAYPTPVPQGNLGTTVTPRRAPRQAPDTGSARYPAPQPQGNIGTTRTTGPQRPTDTGNMAYPAPVPQGNLGNTRTK